MTREEGRARVEELVTRFAQNERYYRSPDYDEESTKQHFITPFFDALGWDVTDQEARGPAHEAVLEMDEEKGALASDPPALKEITEALAVAVATFCRDWPGQRTRAG